MAAAAVLVVGGSWKWGSSRRKVWGAAGRRRWRDGEEVEKMMEGLDEMERRGEAGSRRVHLEVMRRCGEVGALREARRVHQHVRRRGWEGERYVGSGIVEMYVQCGRWEEGEEVQRRWKEVRQSEYSWTALISAHAKGGDASQAVRLYEEMREEGVEGSSYTLVAVLKACGRLEDLKHGRKVHEHVRQQGVDDVFVLNSLMDMYVKCGRMEEARDVFEGMVRRSVVSWNVLILGYAKKEEEEEALALYAQMQEQGFVANEHTYVAVLKACGGLAGVEDGGRVKAGCLEKGRSVEEMMGEVEMRNGIVATALVDMYAKCGSMVDAREVFEGMGKECRDMVSWGALIGGYVEQGENEEAFSLYAQMEEEGVSANSWIFVSMLQACGNMAALEMGKRIHARLGGTVGIRIVANALIDMYAKCGSMGDAKRCFEGMRKEERDVVTWSALISGYARQGETEAVLYWFERMKEEGMKPNAVTFLSVLTVCCHGGLLEEGKKHFAAMSREYDITPSIEHYTCMVDLLARAGQIGDAICMLQSMPFPPDLAAWRAVLAACQKWNQVHLGTLAFQRALQLDQSASAPYVIMANIYAQAHMWQHMDQVRAMRIHARAWKHEPGHSWIFDIPGNVHTFVVADHSHPQATHIYAKLQHLLFNVQRLQSPLSSLPLPLTLPASS